MILLELYSQPVTDMQDMKNDASQYDISNTRKTRLTLAQINRLRKMNDMRTLEHAKELELVRRMYKQPTPDMGGLVM